MAKIKVGSAMPEYGWLYDFYDYSSLKLKSHTSSKAIYEDANGADIVLQGEKLVFKGQNITGGTVQDVQFLNEDGGTLISVANGAYKAHALSATLKGHNDLWDFMTVLTAGNDTISGSKVGSDLNFSENHGNDTIISGKAGSYIGGSEGNDIMRGSAAWDTISFGDTAWRTDDKQGIKLDAVKGTIIDSWGDTDKFDSKFEEFNGSNYGDVMKGSKRNEAFEGSKGKDIIDGGNGWDELRYHRDEHYNGHLGIVANLATGKIKDGFGDTDQVKNIEAVYGTYKNDKFTGDSHDNQFRGLSGVDSFDGGKGKDEVSFSWWEDLGQHGVNVDLSRASKQIIDDGFGNTETTKGIEALGGSAFGDTLKLGKSDGWAWGDDGNDTLTAGIGSQWFGGGAGADTFVFESRAALGSIGKGEDFIDDFSHGEGDHIDMSKIGGLVFKGTSAFSGAAGELHYKISGDETNIVGDTDGDKKADFQITIGAKVALVDGDFIL